MAYTSSPDNANPFYNLFHRFYPNDWYKTYPYYFEIVLDGMAMTSDAVLKPKSYSDGKVSDILGRSAKLGGVDFNSDTAEGNLPPAVVTRMYLPIPPQNLTIQSLNATEATSTMGGVVEEVSEQVFWMITLVGTTGMATRAANTRTSEGVKGELNQELETSGRSEYLDISGEGNLIGRTASTVISAVDKVTNLLALTPEVTLPFAKYGTAVQSPKDAINRFTQDPSRQRDPLTELGNKILSIGTAGIMGIEDESTPYANGFAWDQMLRQFFLIYQREKAMRPQDYALYFVDAKSNARYRCIPKAVQFSKTASNPYTSQYNITLKAWDLHAADDPNRSARAKPADRFSGDLKEVYSVNLTGIYSQLRKIWVLNAKGLSGWTDYGFNDYGSKIKGSAF
jgi:hypothetical protein